MRINVPKIGRDTVLFLGGLAGIFHETVIHEDGERTALLLLFGTMVGLPAFLRSDEAPSEPTAPTTPPAPQQPDEPKTPA